MINYRFFNKSKCNHNSIGTYFIRLVYLLVVFSANNALCENNTDNVVHSLKHSNVQNKQHHIGNYDISFSPTADPKNLQPSITYSVNLERKDDNQIIVHHPDDSKDNIKGSNTYYKMFRPPHGRPHPHGPRPPHPHGPPIPPDHAKIDKSDMEVGKMYLVAKNKEGEMTVYHHPRRPDAKRRHGHPG